MTDYRNPTTNHLGQFRDGWNEAEKGKSPTEQDTWHNMGRCCQSKFGKFVTSKEEKLDFQYQIFLLIVNQRRRVAQDRDNTPFIELLEVPKGKRKSKDK